MTSHRDRPSGDGSALRGEKRRREPVTRDASRAHYIDLFQRAPVAYCVTGEDGGVLEANLAVERLLGLAPGALLDRPLQGFIVKDDHEIYLLHRRRLFETGEPQCCDLRLVTVGRAPRWARLQATLAEESGAPPTCRVVMMDITERWLSEEALARSTDLLVSLREAQALCITQDDPRRVYDALLRTLVSMTESEFGFLDEVLYDEGGAPYKLSLSLSNIAWDSDSKALYHRLCARNLEFRNLANLAGFPATLCQPIISNDAPRDPRAGGLPPGHPLIRAFMGLPVTAGGEVVGVIGVANRQGGYDESMARFLEPYLATCGGIIQALRQRARAEEMLRALKDSRALLASTEAHAMVGGWEWDVEGRTMVWTDETYRIHGLEPRGHAPQSAALIERSLACYQEDDRQVLAAAFQRCLHRGEPYDMECRFTSLDGRSLWVHTIGRPVLAQQRVVKVSGHILDITTRKQAEEELRRRELEYKALAERNEELFAQARREAATKSLLLHEVNHRVKNNLTAVIGLIHAQRRFIREDLRCDFEEVMSELSRRIETLAMVHGLLSATQWEPLRLSHLCDAIFGGTGSLLPRGKSLQATFTGEDARIPAQAASSLALVLFELGTNTVKHGLTARDSVSVAVAGRATDPGFSIEYRDSGPGFPEAVLRWEETSVGLYLVRLLVTHDLRGTLELHNEGGAVVSLRLNPDSGVQRCDDQGRAVHA